MLRRSSAVLGIAALLLTGVPLSAVAQRDVPEFRPHDFNGDGYADLTVGSAGETVGGREWAGAFHVIYGSRDGLRAKRSQMWSRASVGVRGRPRESELFGQQRASGDFNGDGYADLAVGSRNSSDVQVMFGSASRLTGVNQRLRSGPDGQGLGWPVGSGDFDSDGDSELVLARGSYWGYTLLILEGSHSGIVAEGAKVFDPGVPDELEDPVMGVSVATGDLNGDGVDELVMGTGRDPEDRGTTFEGFHVVPGSASGLLIDQSRHWDFRIAGLPPEKMDGLADQLGERLAIGDFDGDSVGDLAVSVPSAGLPGQCVDEWTCSGLVLVIPGSASGPDVRRRTIWSAPDTGPGRARPWEFGAALAAGDLNADGRDDLAIGARGWIGQEDTGGAAWVIYGSPSGLRSAGTQRWEQRSPGVKGASMEGDAFGSGFQIGTFGRHTADDLAIMVPGDRRDDSGSVNVLYGSTKGVTAREDQLWRQDTPGVPGRAERGDRFGSHPGGW
jgi:hypothetical protein